MKINVSDIWRFSWESSRGPLGQSWGALAPFGPFGGCLGGLSRPPRGSLGVLLGRLGGLLDSLGGFFGQYWGPLGPSWGSLGCLLGSLGAILDAAWAVMASRVSKTARTLKNIKNPNENQRFWHLEILLGVLLEPS